MIVATVGRIVGGFRCPPLRAGSCSPSEENSSRTGELERRFSVRPIDLRRSEVSRPMPNGGIGKERLNRRFLISPYGSYPAPWAGRASRRTPRRAASPRALFLPPARRVYIYLGAEARHYTHVTQKLLFFCPAGVRSYEKHEPQGNRHHRHLPLPSPRPSPATAAPRSDAFSASPRRPGRQLGSNNHL